MAVWNGQNMALIAGDGSGSGYEQMVQSRDITNEIRSFTEIVTLDAQAIGDTINVAQIPVGATFLGIRFTTDTSLSTSTLAVGDGTTANRFVAAFTLTSTDTPTVKGKADLLGVVVSATGITAIVLTVAALALPASGTLQVETFFKAQ